MTFQKGQSGNPGGKLKGCISKNRLSLRFWFDQVSDNCSSSKLTPMQKIDIAFKAINVLAPKVGNIPLEPGDSVTNAKTTLEMLTALESAAQKKTDPEVKLGNTDGMGENGSNQ